MKCGGTRWDEWEDDSDRGVERVKKRNIKSNRLEYKFNRQIG